MAGPSAGEEPGAMLAVFAGVEDVAAVLRETRSRPGHRQQERSAAVRAFRAGRRDRAEQGPLRDTPDRNPRAWRVAGLSQPAGRGAVDSFGRSRFGRLSSFADSCFRKFHGASLSRRSRVGARLLAGQLARPVEFVAQIEAMYQMGARTFVEVGPDAKLTALVRAILEGRDHQAIAVDASRGAAGNVDDLACTLASLAAQGYAVDLTALGRFLSRRRLRNGPGLP